MSKPWEETWYVVQVADTSGFGEHAGQWWVYSSPSGSPLFGYQGPPVPEGHANPCRHELANAVLRKARGE